MINIDLNSQFGKIEKPLESDFKPGLSVCMIVMNEEDNIQECIKSLKNIADEIIINDTGSTDDTIEAIREMYEYADTPRITLFKSTWKDHFALARNQAIELADHKWILWVDADDRIPEHSIEGINRLKTAPLDRFFGFQVINTNDDQPIGTRFVQVRMFPNHQKIRFERRIHEQVIGRCANLGLHCFYIPAEIYHTGYENAEEKERKAIRNIRLSNMEPELIGSDPSFTMNLGDSHFILQEWEKGIDIYKKCLVIPNLENIQSDIHTMVPYYIGIGYRNLKEYRDAISWTSLAYDADKSNLNAIYALGTLYELVNEKDKALEWYRKGIEVPYKPGSIGVALDSIRIFSYQGIVNIYVDNSQYEDAVEILLKMKKDYPQLIDIYDLLAKCYGLLGLEEKKRLISEEGKKLLKGVD